MPAHSAPLDYTAGRTIATASIPRNVSIDALRSISILLVLTLHELNYVNVPGLMRPNAGYYGVSLFFAISGFLITGGALTRYGPRLQVAPFQFYRFRASRILPGLLLLAAINVACYLLSVPGFELIKTGPTALPELLFYVFTFQSNVYAIDSLLPNAWGVLWSLAIEEVFYFAFPIICFLIPSRRWLISFLCAIVLVGPLRRFTFRYGIYDYFGCFDQLAMGCIAALAVDTLKPNALLSRLLQIGGAVIAIVSYLSFEPTSSAIGPSMVALGGALFLTGTRFDSIAWPAAHWVTIIGQWSYEIYLFHTMILKFFLITGAIALLETRFGNAATFMLVAAIIVASSGAIAVGLLEPASKWIRGIRSDIGKHRSPWKSFRTELD